MNDLNKLAAENKFNSLEKIKQFHLTLEAFTMESDLLTPTLKIKRHVAKRHFEAIVADLYTKPMLS